MTSSVSASRPGEIGFLLDAIRRYAWVVVAITALGVVVALTAGLWEHGRYSATASLEALPPTRTTGWVLPTDPDRYLETQLVVLGSPAVLGQVSAAVTDRTGSPISSGQLAQMVEIVGEPGTAVIHITTRSEDPQLAAEISQVYAETYVAGLPTSNLDQQRRRELEERAEDLERELAELDERVRTAMAPFVSPESDDAQPSLPGLDLVDPAAVSQRLLVRTELQGVRQALLDLEVRSRIQVNTTVIADAVVPGEREPRELAILPAGIVLGSFFGSIALAMTLARVSPRLLGVGDVEEILGRPVVARIGRMRWRSSDGSRSSSEVPIRADSALDDVCVRIELSRRAPDQAVVAAVTAARSATEASALALALAGRLTERGLRTVLLHHSAAGAAELDELAARVPVAVRLLRLDDDTEHRRPTLDTGRTDVLTILGVDATRRIGPVDLTSRLSDLGSATDVVIVDSGPLDRSADVVEVATTVDATVLVVPLRHQHRQSLQRAADLLDRATGDVLPVVVGSVMELDRQPLSSHFRARRARARRA